MIAFVVILNFLPGELFKYALMDLFLEVSGILLTTSFTLPGLYLWVTGFKRYDEALGGFGPKLVLYFVFTIPYAIYLQYQYESSAKNI
ncbi:hypothetical protein AUP74_01128 [Microbulbifer aggregans]|nr:hypothetical protein AUP74_01128 [Microbulbifer aggregans]